MKLDLADALVLVSCVKSKQARPAPARSLYTSAWFCKVRDLVEASGEKLLPEIADVKRVVMFAGHRYREFLVEALERRAIKVEAPMAHLTRGEQLRWLSEN